MVSNNTTNDVLYDNKTLKYTVLAVGSAATAIGITIFSTLCNIVAFLSMFQAKRVPKAIRIFACSLVMSDLLGEVIYMISQLMLLSSEDVNRRTIRNVRVTAIQSCVFISALTIVILSMERIAVLYCSDTYMKHSSKKLFVTLSLSSWILGSVCTIIYCRIFSIDNWIVCKLLTESGLTLVGRIISWIGYILLSLGILVPNFFIIRAVRTHLSRIHDLALSNEKRCSNRRKMYRSTIAVIVIGLSFFLLHLPMITVSLVIQEASQLNISEEIKANAFNITFMFHQCQCLVNAVVYVWRFKECQLIFIEIFLTWSKYFRDKAAKIREAMIST